MKYRERPAADELYDEIKRDDVLIAKLKTENIRLRKAMETIAAWPFDIKGDCVADARQLAQEALNPQDKAREAKIDANLRVLELQRENERLRAACKAALQAESQRGPDGFPKLVTQLMEALNPREGEE